MVISPPTASWLHRGIQAGVPHTLAFWKSLPRSMRRPNERALFLLCLAAHKWHLRPGRNLTWQGQRKAPNTQVKDFPSQPNGSLQTAD